MSNLNDAVHNAEQALADANLAVTVNADALKTVQADIKKLEAIVPRVTRIDLVRQQMADTARRRAGL
jgi:hypothetical protein